MWRLVKGALASAHLLEISNCNFELIYRTAVSKTAHKKLNGKVARTDGVIIVRNICAKASKHEEDEFAKATRIYKRAVAAEKKKEQVSLNAKKNVWKGLFSKARSLIAVRKKLEVDQRKKV